METSFVNLMRGDPAPRFQAATAGNPNYIFDTVAGRYVVLCFFVSAGTPGGAAALQAVSANRHRFDDERLCFFESRPIRTTGTAVASSRACRACATSWISMAASARATALSRAKPWPGSRSKPGSSGSCSIPTLRVLEVIPFRPGGADLPSTVRLSRRAATAPSAYRRGLAGAGAAPAQRLRAGLLPQPHRSARSAPAGATRAS